MRGCDISKATLGRIPQYLKYLISLSNIDHISATAIAKNLGFGEVQVRKDLGCVCGKGKPKIGYVREELIESLSRFLSCEQGNAIIVGAGKLGTALLEYDGFREYGIQVSAAFDKRFFSEQITESGKKIYPISDLTEYCQNNKIDIGIITVPPESAQKILNLLCENGIKNICCFAPCKLYTPSDVTVQYENLALSLAYLKSHINR